MIGEGWILYIALILVLQWLSRAVHSSSSV